MNTIQRELYAMRSKDNDDDSYIFNSLCNYLKELDDLHIKYKSKTDRDIKRSHLSLRKKLLKKLTEFS